MFRKVIEPFTASSKYSGTPVVPFESLGERIRSARDQGVGLPVTNGLEFDLDEDGDQVDPMADPRSDFFDLAEGLDAYSAMKLAEEKRVSELDEAAKLAAAGGSAPEPPTVEE